MRIKLIILCMAISFVACTTNKKSDIETDTNGLIIGGEMTDSAVASVEKGKTDRVCWGARTAFYEVEEARIVADNEEPAPLPDDPVQAALVSMSRTTVEAMAIMGNALMAFAPNSQADDGPECGGMGHFEQVAAQTAERQKTVRAVGVPAVKGAAVVAGIKVGGDAIVGIAAASGPTIGNLTQNAGGSSRVADPVTINPETGEAITSALPGSDTSTNNNTLVIGDENITGGAIDSTDTTVATGILQDDSAGASVDTTDAGQIKTQEVSGDLDDSGDGGLF